MRRFQKSSLFFTPFITPTSSTSHHHHHLFSFSLYSSSSSDTSIMATHCASLSEKDGRLDIGDAEWKKKLTPQQYKVLREKDTDPLHGPLDDFYGEGHYNCAACGTTLYTSAMKYACGCGWPGFWDCIPKTVREEPDADGRRTEILCNACNSHLGHVFRNEGFKNPPPNERHCVNSTAVVFVPASETAKE